MFRDHRLVKNNGSRRVYARGYEASSHFPSRTTQFFRIMRGRDGVQVHHTINCFELILEPGPVSNGAQVIAEVKTARGLHTRKYSIFRHL